VNCRKSCNRCRYVRVNNEQEIASFMEEKRAAIERKRQEAKEKREARRILEGAEL
jgi:hypothetical protein